MNIEIALLPGDGVGPDVTAQAVKCLQAVEETFGHRFIFTEAAIGDVAISRYGHPLPEATLRICRESDAILLGIPGRPEPGSRESKSPAEQSLYMLRRELDLFCNIRPVKVFPTILERSPLRKPVLKGTDLVLYRELSGGINAGNPVAGDPESEAQDVITYSEKQVSRIAHLAFKAAKGRRKKLTLVDKAPVLNTSMLWRKVVSRIAESYPEVSLHFMTVDEAAMQLVLEPSQFDVLLTENLFGDILSDQAGIICGSAGLLPSASIGEQQALFRPVQAPTPTSRRRNHANPIASILSAAMLMEHFGLREETTAIVMAVYQAMKKNIVTPDLQPKSKYSTEHVGEFIANNIVDSDDTLNINRENIGLGKSTII